MATRTFRQVERGDFSLQLDFVRERLAAPRVPKANFLVEVPADDGRARAVGGHQVVATGSGELRLDARLAAQIPHLQRAIMTASYDLLRFADKLRSHHLATVPC